MKDQELFELIKKAVRDKKTIPHHSETQNFADRYCAQQLSRRKLNNHRSHEKMDFLMKNFSKLETYFDLPELLNSIKMLKLNKQNDRGLKTSARIQAIHSKQDEIKSSWNKHFTDMKNLRYIIESDKIKDILNEIEDVNQFRIQSIKNNSFYNVDFLLDKITDQKQNTDIEQTNKLFQMLQKYQQNQQKFMHKEKPTAIKQTSLNSEEKKMFTNFLHKVSSYLQIVLEMEHRSKWSHHENRTSFNKKNAQNFIKLNKKEFKRPSQLRHVPITKNLSNTRFIQVIKQETSIIRQSYHDELPKVKSKFITTTAQCFTQNKSRSKEKDIQNSKQFSKTTPTYLQSNRQSQLQIRQNFTFRRRSVKQKIINRLDKFIGQIDEESHCNKKQNRYYNEEINKLQNQFKRLYGRYKRQTLAGDNDIENLKKMASTFQVKTPSRMSKNMQGEQFGSQSSHSSQVCFNDQ